MSTPHSVLANDFSTMDDDALAAAVSTLAAHIHAATYRLLALTAELDLGRTRGAVLRPLAELGVRHRYPYRPGEDPRRAGADRAAVTLRGAGQGRARSLQGSGDGPHRHRRERNRPPQHRAARHRAACREVRPPCIAGRSARKRPSGTDVQHENHGLTFWHEDDGNVVLHGRLPPEMGARILSALDAAMTAHAAEPAGDGVGRRRVGAGGRPSWDVSTRHILRRCSHRCRCSGPGHGSPEGRRPGVPDRRPTWDVHPRSGGIAGRSGAVRGCRTIRVMCIRYGGGQKAKLASSMAHPVPERGVCSVRRLGTRPTSPRDRRLAAPCWMS